MIEWIAPAVAATVAAVAGFFGGRRVNAATANARNADAASTLTGAALQLVEELQAQVNELRDQVNRFQALVGALESEIVALGGDPARIRRMVEEA